MPVHWTTGTAAGAGVDIAWRRVGDRGPTWVLLHGFSDNGRCWERVAGALADRATVIALDARNHGESGTGPGGVDVHADDVVSVLDELALGPVTLMGHSVGGRTAAMVAARRPELVESLVLVDPAWRDASDESFARRRDHVVAYIESLAASSEAELSAVASAQHGDWDPIDHEPWIEAKQQLRPEAADDLAPAAWRGVAAAIPCTTTVVYGDVDRGSIAAEIVDDVAATNPQVRGAHLAGTGHNIQREDFAAFVELLDTLV